MSRKPYFWQNTHPGGVWVGFASGNSRTRSKYMSGSRRIGAMSRTKPLLKNGGSHDLDPPR